MDINYLKAIDNLKFCKGDIEKLNNSAKRRTFEDNKAYFILDNFLVDIENVISSLEYYSKPTVEGKLQENETGKFDFVSSKGEELKTFSCGSTLEVLNNGEWYAGRVEAKAGYYYFYNEDLQHPKLYTGMKCRIRL